MKLLLLLLWTLYLISCAKTGKFGCTSTKQCKRHFKKIGDSTWNLRFCRYRSPLAPKGTCKYIPGGIKPLVYVYHDEGDGGNPKYLSVHPHMTIGEGGNSHAKKIPKKKTVFIKSRRICYTTQQCQNWRKASKSPLWKKCFCSKGKGQPRGYCKYAKDLDAVSDLAQEKTYDQLLGYDRVDLAIVLGFGGILGAIGTYLSNKEGNNAKF